MLFSTRRCFTAFNRHAALLRRCHTPIARPAAPAPGASLADSLASLLAKHAASLPAGVCHAAQTLAVLSSAGVAPTAPAAPAARSAQQAGSAVAAVVLGRAGAAWGCAGADGALLIPPADAKFWHSFLHTFAALFAAVVELLLAEGEELLWRGLIFCMGGSTGEDGGAEQATDNFLLSPLSHADKTQAELDENLRQTEKKDELTWRLSESNLAE